MNSLANAFSYWQGQTLANSSHSYLDDLNQAFGHVQNVAGSTDLIEIWNGETGWPTDGLLHLFSTNTSTTNHFSKEEPTTNRPWPALKMQRPFTNRASAQPSPGVSTSSTLKHSTNHPSLPVLAQMGSQRMKHTGVHTQQLVSLNFPCPVRTSISNVGSFILHTWWCGI